MVRFVCLPLALFATFCIGATAPVPKGGGTLQFGLSRDITNLNPFQRANSINKDVGSLAFECLLTSDRNGDLKPSLAASWETSKDGLRYTFRLRKGVKFHNGKEMTAEDVIWSIQYAMDPKNGAYGRDALVSIVSVTEPDPLTLQLALKEPYVPLLASITGFEAFPVVAKGSVSPGREKMNLYPPGTGPFQMTDYRPNQLIVFQKFDQYWQKGVPLIDAIRFRPVEDNTVRFTALRTGDVDMADKPPYDQVVRIQKGELRELGVEFAGATGYRALIFNTEVPPFNNVKLRQAVAYAIDKSKIMEGITWGVGPITNQKVLRDSRWWVSMRERERDLTRARALLKEAGYPNGLKVKAQISRGWPNPEVMQLIQSQLKDIEVVLELELIDSARDQEDKRAGNFVIGSTGGAAYIDPDLAYYKSFHTEKEPMKVANHSRYSNPKLDRLTEQGRTEPDFQKRYRIYKEVVETLEEEVPQVSLGFAHEPFAFRSPVKGFRVHANGAFFYGVGGLGMTWLER